jgi:redox-sensitive bicupin YhaK (pirin superfamily)
MKDMTVYERYLVGQERLAAGDPQGAARALEPAVEEETTSVALWLLLAQAYFASARLRPAQAAFERVVELDPTDHHARFGLGRTFERQGRHQEALSHYRVALAMSSNPDYEAALLRVEARVAHQKPGQDQVAETVTDIEGSTSLESIPAPEHSTEAGGGKVVNARVALEGREAVSVEDPSWRQILGFPILEALPSANVPYAQVDPFILVHEGRIRLTPEVAERDTKHPHRGFDNLWYQLEGSTSTGHSTGPGGTIERARLGEGALLMLRTGRGVWHADALGADDVEEGLAGIESRSVLFWVNLARKDKQVEPSALVVQPDQMAVRQEGAATVRVLVDDGSVVRLGTPALILDVELPDGGEVTTPVPSEFHGFAYVLEGEAAFGANRRRATPAQLVVMGPGEAFTVTDAAPGTRYLLMAGRPYGEAPLFNGPFVD